MIITIIVYNSIIMENLLSISVPRSFPEERPLKAREMLSTAKGTMALGGISPEGQKVLGLVQESLNISDYVQTSKDSPKLEGNRFQNFQDSVDDIRVNGFSLKKLGMMIVSTAFIAQAYISYYETVTGGASSLYIPFSGALFPAYGIYSSTNAIPEDYQNWLNAEGSDERYDAFFALMGTGTKMAYHVVTLAGYLFFAEVAETVNLGLFTLMYIASIADIMKAEYDSSPTIEDKYNTPPMFLKV